MNRILITALCLLLLLASCQTVDHLPEEVQIDYATLRLQPYRDTIFVATNSAAWSLGLTGTVITTSEVTMTNTGVMTSATLTVRTVDTAFVPVDAAKALWTSTNSAVASVSNGVITPKSAGTAGIVARIRSTSSDTLIVVVRAVNTAPGLSLDPPSTVFILQNSVPVSGSTLPTAKVNMKEPQSGITIPSVAVGTDGTFSTTVTGLTQGIRTITVRAVHPSDSTLATERTKNVIYYEPNTPGANQIVGDWLGTTLTKTFPFAISHSIIPTRYDITGKLDIQFDGIGIVRDIDLIGVLNPNGTISATLSKSYQGFTITGSFNGRFTGTGTGNGSYSARAAKSGWPTIAFGADWTAVKQ